MRFVHFFRTQDRPSLCFSLPQFWHNLIPFFLVFNTQVQLWGLHPLQTCQNPPLEAGPCCDSRSPSRKSWVFSQDSRDCERFMKRKTPLPRERDANTLCFLPLKAGPVVSTAVFCFLCYLNNHLPTGPSNCG